MLESAQTCAYVGPDNVSCPNEAEWLIVWDGEEGESVESCIDHLNLLIEDSSDYVVYPLKEEKEVTDNLDEVKVSQVESDPVSLHTLDATEHISCPRRMEMTDGYVDPNLDFWEYRSDEHFQRCSYCGSVRPDDVFGLLRSGWAVQETDKAYRFNIIPPAWDPKRYSNPIYKIYRQHFGIDDALLSKFLSAAFGGVWRKTGGKWVRSG